MKPHELESAKLQFIAQLKAFSEHSTLLTGHFRHGLSQDFKALIRMSDRLINDLEKRLTEEQKEYLQGVTDVYHNINLEIRKEADKRYLELSAKK